MVYHAIGLMSGSSLDGLDIIYAVLEEKGGKWTFEIPVADCYSYDQSLIESLQSSVRLSSLEYQLLHTRYGHYLGQQVNRFITQHGLAHKIHLVCSHGHTSFHIPGSGMTAQLGDGAAIAAETRLPVVSDLRALDVALGGQGAPIVPIGEKLLFGDYSCFLNIGGIANISFSKDGSYTAFDVCPANRVLNLLAAEKGMNYDEGGQLAASGSIDHSLLEQLDAKDYYRKNPPKSLSNDFGVEILFPMIMRTGIDIPDALSTYTEHIARQVAAAFDSAGTTMNGSSMLVTGGGAFNSFLISRIQAILAEKNIGVILPDEKIIQYKEALVMALIGVLRWREEPTVLNSVTGAEYAGIGGALWLGNK